MRETRLGRTGAALVAFIVAVAPLLPGVAARCETASGGSHALCCCRNQAAEATGTHTAAAPATSRCCNATKAHSPAPAPDNEKSHDGGCRCTLDAPALPFEAQRVAPPASDAVALVAPRAHAPLARPAAVVVANAPGDELCHAPPDVGGRITRGPPALSCSS